MENPYKFTLDGNIENTNKAVKWLREEYKRLCPEEYEQMEQKRKQKRREYLKRKKEKT